MRSLLLCGILIVSPTVAHAQDIEGSAITLRTPVEQVSKLKPSFVAMPILAAAWAWRLSPSINHEALNGLGPAA